MAMAELGGKQLEIDEDGFIQDPDQWDEYYAVHRAAEIGINGGKLTDKHWEIIRFLRRAYKNKKEIPTVYEACRANGIDLEEMERLFSHGYHRGAVKIAGLRVG